MEVGEEDGDLAAGQQEVGNLGHGHEVSDVRLAGRGSAPVDLQVPGLQDLVDPFITQNFLEVPGDELLLLSRTQVRARRSLDHVDAGAEDQVLKVLVAVGRRKSV